jgi:hypothetical protein
VREWGAERERKGREGEKETARAALGLWNETGGVRGDEVYEERGGAGEGREPSALADTHRTWTPQSVRVSVCVCVLWTPRRLKARR